MPPGTHNNPGNWVFTEPQQYYRILWYHAWNLLFCLLQHHFLSSGAPCTLTTNSPFSTSGTRVSPVCTSPERICLCCQRLHILLEISLQRSCTVHQDHIRFRLHILRSIRQLNGEFLVSQTLIKIFYYQIN